MYIHIIKLPYYLYTIKLVKHKTKYKTEQQMLTHRFNYFITVYFTITKFAFSGSTMPPTYSTISNSTSDLLTSEEE